MTGPEKQQLRKASSARRPALALLVGLLLAVLTSAVGAGPSAAETRVGVSHSASILLVGPSASIAAGHVGVHTVPGQDVASATCVAAKGANEGIYVVRAETGTYVGQSGNITQRLGQHVSTGKFTQAEVNAAERIGVTGGKTARELAEQLKIDSPEFGGIDNLLNKVNPIGTRRLDLMPEGYTR